MSRPALCPCRPLGCPGPEIRRRPTSGSSWNSSRKFMQTAAMPGVCQLVAAPARPERTAAAKACVLRQNPYKPRVPLIGRELNGRPLLKEAVGPLVRRPVFPPSEQSSLSEGLEGLGAERRTVTEERHSMPLYEHVYLARQDVSTQQVEELTAQLKGVIEQMGGTVPKLEYWGVKSLTFRIRKNRKAHFMLMNVDAPPAALAEIERQERINEDVLRYLTVRVEELEEGPSAMMRKVDRADRGERGERGERGGGFRDRAARGRGFRDRGDPGGGGFGARGAHRRAR